MKKPNPAKGEADIMVDGKIPVDNFEVDEVKVDDVGEDTDNFNIDIHKYKGAAITAGDGAEFVEKVVFINRCAKVVKGGRRFSFSALVVSGNKASQVGLGFGKANEVSDAIKKASESARKDVKTINIVNGTIPHEIYAEHGGGKVLLKPASPGTGIIAGGGVRAICEVAGIHDILTKSLGSSNHANVVKAALKALSKLRTREQILKSRDKSVKTKAI